MLSPVLLRALRADEDFVVFDVGHRDQEVGAFSLQCAWCGHGGEPARYDMCLDCRESSGFWPRCTPNALMFYQCLRFLAKLVP